MFWPHKRHFQNILLLLFFTSNHNRHFDAASATLRTKTEPRDGSVFHAEGGSVGDMLDGDEALRLVFTNCVFPRRDVLAFLSAHAVEYNCSSNHDRLLYPAPSRNTQ